MGQHLLVHRQHGRAGGDEVVDVAVWLLDHQVHVEGPRGHFANRADLDRTDRDVRHEMPVHDVDVNEICPAALDRRNVLSQIREICRQDGGRDLNHWLTSSEMPSAGPTRNPPGGCCRTTVPGGTPWYGCEPTIVTRKPRVRSVSAARSPLVPMRSGITYVVACSPRFKSIDTRGARALGAGSWATTASAG